MREKQGGCVRTRTPSRLGGADKRVLLGGGIPAEGARRLLPRTEVKDRPWRSPRRAFLSSALVLRFPVGPTKLLTAQGPNIDSLQATKWVGG